MRPSWALIDTSQIGETVASLKAGLIPNLQRMVKEVRDLLSGGLTISDNMLAEVVRVPLVSGVQSIRDNPRRFRPIGATPIAAVEASGAALNITSFSFDSTAGSTTQHGLSVTVASGTIDTVTCVLWGG